MQAKQPTKAKQREKGAELVEMAFVLPLLLVLLLGIIAFGRAYDVYQTITRAAREGAREAVLTGCATCADATTVPSASVVWSNFIEPALQAASLDPSRVNPNPPNINYAWLDPSDTICGIQVSFKYPYTLTLPFTGLNLTTLNIPTEVQMRLENQSAANPPTCPP